MVDAAWLLYHWHHSPPTWRDAEDRLDELMGVYGWRARWRETGGLMRCQLCLHVHRGWHARIGEAQSSSEAFLTAYGKWSRDMAETKGQIFELMMKVRQEIGVIGKEGTNTFQRYNYRKIEDVVNRLHEVFVANQILLLPHAKVVHREVGANKSGDPLARIVLEVNYQFVAPDGSSVEATVPGEGADALDKSSNKAMSGALKYLANQVFLIPFEMVDNEDPKHEPRGTSAGAPAGRNGPAKGQQNGQQNGKPSNGTAQQNHGLPRSGKELWKRLKTKEEEMVKAGLCQVDELIDEVFGAGQKNNLPKKIIEWSGDNAMQLAVNTVANFEKFAKERRAGAAAK